MGGKISIDEKISKYRSEIIEKFINTEWIINSIISIHYFKVAKFDFLFEILYDEYFSFGLRRRILEKILTKRGILKNKIIQKLNRMNNIRNYFAHCNNKYIEKGGKEYIPNPKKIGEAINFTELYKEFIENEKDVLSYLIWIIEDKMNIKLPKDIPD